MYPENPDEVTRVRVILNRASYEKFHEGFRAGLAFLSDPQNALELADWARAVLTAIDADEGDKNDSDKPFGPDPSLN